MVDIQNQRLVRAPRSRTFLVRLHIVLHIRCFMLYSRSPIGLRLVGVVIRGQREICINPSPCHQNAADHYAQQPQHERHQGQARPICGCPHLFRAPAVVQPLYVWSQSVVSAPDPSTERRGAGSEIPPVRHNLIQQSSSRRPFCSCYFLCLRAPGLLVLVGIEVVDVSAEAPRRLLDLRTPSTGAFNGPCRSLPTLTTLTVERMIPSIDRAVASVLCT